MEFKINKHDLVGLINKVSPGLEDGKIIPIYADILISVYDNGVSLSTTSSEMQMKSFFPLTADGAASFGVNGKLFSDIIKNLPDGEIKFVISETNTLRISMGRKYVNLNLKPAEDFPLSPSYENMTFTPMPGFMESVMAVSYAVATDETKGVQWCCIYVDNLEFASTDGFRLAIRKHNLPIDGSFLIPAKLLGKISKVFKEDVEIFLDVEANYLHVKKDLTVCSIRTVAKDYIKYRPIIPVGAHDVATIRKVELVEALKLMSVVDDKQQDAFLEFKPGLLKVSKRDQAVGEIQDELAIDFIAEKSLGINWGFMMTMLSHLKSDTISIEIYGELRPLVIKEGDDTHVLMPKKYNH